MPAAAVKLPTPTVSIRATSSHPSIDEPRPALRAASSRYTVKKAVVSRGKTRITSCSPPFPVIQVPPAFRVRLIYTRRYPSRGRRLVAAAAKRCIVKPSIDTRTTVNVKTHKAIGDVGSPIKCPSIAEERASRHSAKTQQLAPLQGQSSKFPGAMGEKRRAYVADKINEANARLRSPENPAVLTLPTPPIPPSPRTRHEQRRTNEG